MNPRTVRTAGNAKSGQKEFATFLRAGGDPQREAATSVGRNRSRGTQSLNTEPMGEETFHKKEQETIGGVPKPREHSLSFAGSRRKKNCLRSVFQKKDNYYSKEKHSSRELGVAIVVHHQHNPPSPRDNSPRSPTIWSDEDSI